MAVPFVYKHLHRTETSSAVARARVEFFLKEVYLVEGSVSKSFIREVKTAYFGRAFPSSGLQYVFTLQIVARPFGSHPRNRHSHFISRISVRNYYPHPISHVPTTNGTPDPSDGPVFSCRPGSISNNIITIPTSELRRPIRPSNPIKHLAATSSAYGDQHSSGQSAPTSDPDHQCSPTNSQSNPQQGWSQQLS
jgi:hypothetical protein